MASPASKFGNPIPDPVNPGKPNMKIQPIFPKPKPKLSKMAQKYRGIKQTKEVNPVYNTY
jgi:hypothetical protein